MVVIPPTFGREQVTLTPFIPLDQMYSHTPDWLHGTESRVHVWSMIQAYDAVV